jgi:hypothetical protein
MQVHRRESETIIMEQNLNLNTEKPNKIKNRQGYTHLHTGAAVVPTAEVRWWDHPPSGLGEPCACGEKLSLTCFKLSRLFRVIDHHSL